MKLKFLIFSLLIVFCSLLIVPAMAQDSTNSGTITDDQVKENLKERLEKAAKSETGNVLGENTKKAYVGTLESISQNTLSIKTQTSTKQAGVNDEAKIIGSKREVLKVDDLEIGSYLIVIGFATDKEVLDARRIVVSEKPSPPTYQAYRVKITSIKKDAIAIASTEDSSKSWQMESTKDTSFTQSFESNQTEITQADLKADDILVILAKTDVKTPTILEPMAVHLVTGRAIISEPEESTTSAKKSSPAPSPKE